MTREQFQRADFLIREKKRLKMLLGALNAGPECLNIQGVNFTIKEDRIGEKLSWTIIQECKSAIEEIAKELEAL